MRTPTDGTVTDAKIATTLSPSKITGTAVVAADARLSDARTPTAHKTSHATGGTDALAPSDIGAQAADSDLTAIAALATTSYGRAFLVLADAAAGRTALGLGTAATQASSAFDTAGAAAGAQAASQPVDSDLSAIAALTTTTYGRAFLALADAAAARTVVGLGSVDNTSDAGKPVSTSQQAALDLKAVALAPTVVKTAAYTAAANDYVPVDTTSGAVTITLPTAPTDKTRIGIKHVIQGGTNAVSYVCGGSDVFNKTGGATTGTLPLASQAVLLQYKASTGIWYVQAADLTLSSLDARFVAGALDTDVTFAANSNTHVPSQQAIAAYVAALLVAQTNTDVQVFTANGTWTKPTGRTPKRVRGWVVNPGSGGGAGRKSASGTAAFGGGAGPGGGRAYAELDPSLLGATEPVSVGVGGIGGPSQTTNSTNGAGSSAPNATTFGTGSLISAGTAGGGGGGGSTTTGSAGAAGTGMFSGTVGGIGNAGAGTGATTSTAGCGGGGGGGGLATTPVASAGGVGGGSRTWGSALGGAGGTAPGGVGAPGVSQGASSIMPGTGGGGGASSTSGDAGAGGAGGFPGGGGGGGGAALDGVGNSGAGGNGGGGICVVITDF
jgi:hypothetical protein